MTPSQLFSALIAAAKNNLLTAALPVVITFLTNVKSNPNPLNFVAQLDLLRAGLVAALPNLEVTEIQQLSTLFSNELQDVLKAAEAATPK